MSSGHPLPPVPVQQQGRPRAKSSFSFRSNSSHKSNGSVGKADLHESHEEKAAQRLTSKADPRLAMSEEEPSAVASSVKSELASIRAIQHRDAQGNPISDPDRSNPTRSRWERPLDTIRAFEAAIDGNYSRKSYMRTESVDTVSNFNRRSSYFGGTNITTDERSRFPQNSYYGGRPQSYRPESRYMNGVSSRDSYYNYGPDYAGPSNGYYPNRARYPRTASEPHFNNGQDVYPTTGNQQSYETVTTASGSGSSADPAGYSTDPSSENSSVDRIQAAPKDPVDNYGFNGFGGSPQYAPPGIGINGQYGQYGQYGHQGHGPEMSQGNGYHSQGPPPLPRKDSAASRAPIKLGSSRANSPSTYEVPRPLAGEKRKSWFGKRFSKG